MITVLTTNRATSLKNVSIDIARVAQSMGVKARLMDRMVSPHEAMRSGTGVVIVMCADPLIATSWFLLARDMNMYGVPNIFYATVEGKINKKHVYPWMSRIRFVANSRYTAGKLSEVGLSVVDVVHHGIDMELVDSSLNARHRALEYLEKLGLDPEKHTVVLTVSNSHPRKGLSLYDVVISYVEKRDPSVKFLVLTENRGVKYFKNHQSLVISTDFGKLQRDLVLALIGSAHVLAVPSLAEGFGLPVLESMALGTPVVHAELPPLMEFSTGFVVKVTDVVYYDRIDVTGSGLIFEHHIYEAQDFAETLMQVVDMVRNKREAVDEWRAKSREVADKMDIRKLYPALIKHVLS